jgi:hypothetical protein
MTQETLCRSCDAPISHKAKCGAMICPKCCHECRMEDDGVCQYSDFKHAIQENKDYAESVNFRARTQIR